MAHRFTDPYIVDMVLTNEGAQGCGKSGLVQLKTIVLRTLVKQGASSMWALTAGVGSTEAYHAITIQRGGLGGSAPSMKAHGSRHLLPTAPDAGPSPVPRPRLNPDMVCSILHGVHGMQHAAGCSCRRTQYRHPDDAAQKSKAAAQAQALWDKASDPSSRRLMSDVQEVEEETAAESAAAEEIPANAVLSLRPASQTGKAPVKVSSVAATPAASVVRPLDPSLGAMMLVR